MSDTLNETVAAVNSSIGMETYFTCSAIDFQEMIQ